jgi:hypothetical protein
MTRETALTATISYDTPRIVLQRLPEDASQALLHVTSILSLNDDTEIEPGELHGMSRMLAHASRTWREMRGGRPSAFMPLAGMNEGEARSARKAGWPWSGHRWGAMLFSPF